MNGVWLVSYVALWVVVLLLGFVTLALVRIVRDSNNRWTSSPSMGLKIGQKAPEVTLVDANTEVPIHMSSFRGSPLVALFTDAVCASCHDVAPKVQDFYLRHQGQVDVIVICRADAPAARTFATATKLTKIPVFYDTYGDLSLAFDVTLTPLALIFDADGTVRDKVMAIQMGDLDRRFAACMERAKLPA